MFKIKIEKQNDNVYDPKDLYVLDYGSLDCRIEGLRGRSTFSPLRKVIAVEVSGKEKLKFLKKTYNCIFDNFYGGWCHEPRFMNRFYGGDPNTRFFKLITHNSSILPCLSGQLQATMDSGVHEITSKPVKLSMLFPATCEQKFVTIQELCDKENELNHLKSEPQPGQE